jgi:hypothetical protein
MPRYVYRCLSCEGHFQVWHGMNDNYNKCDLCDVEDHLVRVPQIPSIKEVAVNKPATGDITKDYIKQNQELLKEMKKEARNRTYED